MTENGYLILGLIGGGLLVAIAFWLGRRREDGSATVLSKIELLERAQERGERMPREEMTRGREENANAAKSQREELTASLESARRLGRSAAGRAPRAIAHLGTIRSQCANAGRKRRTRGLCDQIAR